VPLLGDLANVVQTEPMGCLELVELLSRVPREKELAWCTYVTATRAFCGVLTVRSTSIQRKL